MPDNKQPDSNPERINLPDLAALAELAILHGEVEALVGLRPHADEVQLHWDIRKGPESDTPVYHIYGFGGAGLTMAPAAARRQHRISPGH